MFVSVGFHVISKIFEAAKVWKNRQGKGLKVKANFYANKRKSCCTHSTAAFTFINA
jgi:hypothetical protein